jgi:dipeptidase
MCDTMGIVFPGAGALFAKNSDRGPNEAQVLEYRPAGDHGPGRVRTTYIEVDGAPHTWGVLLSRPRWLWGAEIGVNEHGVAIGNEAVFTKGPYAKTGLTGMDLLRLALERCENAKGALETIIALLERYGQGGNCGYDHDFYYDNSFLIVDPVSLYVLETAGRSWAYRRMDRASISNQLTLGTDADGYSGGVKGSFAAVHSDRLYSYFSGARVRRGVTLDCAAKASDIAGLMAGLRVHEHEDAPLTRAGVRSPCMHAGGLVGDHTTASMAVELRPGAAPLVWATGTSLPCVSLFKPWRFGDPLCPPVYAAGDGEAERYWRRHETFRRAAMGRTLPGEFYAERDALEQDWMRASRKAGSLEALSRRAAAEEAQFYARWEKSLTGARRGKRGFLSYWRKKDAALDRPARPAFSEAETLSSGSSSGIGQGNRH